MPSLRRMASHIAGQEAVTGDEPLFCTQHTADVCLGMSERFWIDPQADYDIEIERETHAAELAKL